MTDSRITSGWQVVIGLLVFAGMTTVLAAIAEDVLTGAPLTLLDAQLSDWLHRHRSAKLTFAFVVITALGSTWAAIPISVFLGVYLLRQGRKYWFTIAMIAIFGGMLLNRSLKLAFQRARPQLEDPILSFTGYSFPSGHTITATLLFGTLAAVLIARTKSKTKQAGILTVTFVLIGLVGLSRIYLGAHYLSDVMGAVSEGLAWLSLCLSLAYYFRRERLRNSSS